MNESMPENGRGKRVLILRARSSLCNTKKKRNNERSGNLSYSCPHVPSDDTKIDAMSDLG